VESLKKVFGRVQFYNKTSEYFETIEDLMGILFRQQSEKGLVEYMVVYGATLDGRLYRAVFDFSSFSEEGLAMDQLELHSRKFQKYIGEMLVEQKIITSDQLKNALREQAKSKLKERLGEVLVRMGYVKNAEILSALTKQLGLKIEE